MNIGRNKFKSCHVRAIEWPALKKNVKPNRRTFRASFVPDRWFVYSSMLVQESACVCVCLCVYDDSVHISENEN